MFQRGRFYPWTVTLLVGWLIGSNTPARALEIIHPIGGGSLTNLLPSGDVISPPLVPDADGIAVTGIGTDLAIRGAGWFVVREPSTGLLLYTRQGDFRLDASGYLITAQGYRVQGFMLPDQILVGDIQIDDRFRPQTTDPAATMTTFWIERDGGIIAMMSDGTQYRRAQILLQNFSVPKELERVEPQLFGSTVAAQPANTLGAPETNGLGQIESSALDLTPTAPQLQSLVDAERTPLLRGAITRTSRGSDLAIRGAGAFIVRDPVTGELFATRAGMFLVDADNYLITYDRKRLQGLIAGQLQVGDLQLSAATPATSDPDAHISHFWVERDGRIEVMLTDGSGFIAGTILLYDFQRPEKLVATSLSQFARVHAAQPFAVTNVGQWGGEFSRIQSAGLELVNVSPDLLARRRQLPSFVQGALERTGRPTDLAVDGNGFFLLQHPVTGKQAVTRDGRFQLDEAGYLVNAQGWRLQGDPTCRATTVGDLRITTNPLPNAATLTFFSISRNGYINGHYSDGRELVLVQVLLVDFKEPFLLRKQRDGRYGNLAAAQPRALAAPGTEGLGNVESSALELPSEPERLVLATRDGYRFLISSGLAARWQIQASYNAVTWRTLEVIEPAGGETEFSDRAGHGPQPRYYRVVANYAEPQFNRPDLRFSNVLTNTPDRGRCEPQKSRR
jgi:flagellar hook protein FlgE